MLTFELEVFRLRVTDDSPASTRETEADAVVEGEEAADEVSVGHPSRALLALRPIAKTGARLAQVVPLFRKAAG